MPRVRFLIQFSGFRDGVEYPPVGGVLDVPELEADDLERCGFAERVAVEKAAPEKATAPAAETAATPKPRTRKA